MSSQSFTSHLVRVLLTLPEDDTGRDYKMVRQGEEEDKECELELRRFDNERSFFALQSTSLFGLRTTMWTKSILLDLIPLLDDSNKLDSEIVSMLIQCDVRGILEDWWMLSVQRQREMERKIFSQREAESHFNLSVGDHWGGRVSGQRRFGQLDASHVITSWSVNTVSDVAERVNRVKSCLMEVKGDRTGRRLVESVHPQLRQKNRVKGNESIWKICQDNKSLATSVTSTSEAWKARGFSQSSVKDLYNKSVESWNEVEPKKWFKEDVEELSFGRDSKASQFFLSLGPRERNQLFLRWWKSLEGQEREQRGLVEGKVFDDLIELAKQCSLESFQGREGVRRLSNRKLISFLESSPVKRSVRRLRLEQVQVEELLIQDFEVLEEFKLLNSFKVRFLRLEHLNSVTKVTLKRMKRHNNS